MKSFCILINNFENTDIAHSKIQRNVSFIRDYLLITLEAYTRISSVKCPKDQMTLSHKSRNKVSGQ